MHASAFEQGGEGLGTRNLVFAVVNGLLLNLGLGAVKDVHVFVAARARDVQVSRAVGRTCCKTVVGGDHLADECGVAGHGLADDLAAVAGHDLKLLAALKAIKINAHIAHAIGNTGYRSNGQAGVNANQASGAGVVVVNQHRLKRGRADRRRFVEFNTGVGSAGVVCAFNDTKLGCSRNAHRVFNRNANPAGCVSGGGVKAKELKAGITVTVNALLVNGIDFFGKSFCQVI